MAITIPSKTSTGEHFQYVLKSADLRAHAAQHRRPTGRRLIEIGISSVVPASCLITRQRGHLGVTIQEDIPPARPRPDRGRSGCLRRVSGTAAGRFALLASSHGLAPR